MSSNKNDSTFRRPAADRRKGSSTAGNATYCLLRLADLPLQHALLSGLGARIIKSLKGVPVQSIAKSGITSLGATSGNGIFGLSPYHSLILLLAAGSATKHVWWTLRIRNYIFAPGLATGIALYNTIWNTTNSLIALWRVTSNAPYALSPSSSWTALLDPRVSSVGIGLALYTLGMAIEITSEVQRRSFKARPENKDRPCATGLFGWARNINYGGYLLWRVGYATVCGGLGWGLFTAALQGADFAFRAVPEMDAYCEQRYDRSWDEVRAKVPYRILPWLY